MPQIVYDAKSISCSMSTLISCPDFQAHAQATMMGEMTTRLLDKWSSNVGLDIVQQIKDYAKDTDIDSGASPYEFKKK